MAAVLVVKILWCVIFCLSWTSESGGRGGVVTRAGLAQARREVRSRFLIIFLAAVALRLRLSRVVARCLLQKGEWADDWAKGASQALWGQLAAAEPTERCIWLHAILSAELNMLQLTASAANRGASRRNHGAKCSEEHAKDVKVTKGNRKRVRRPPAPMRSHSSPRNCSTRRRSLLAIPGWLLNTCALLLSNSVSAASCAVRILMRDLCAADSRHRHDFLDVGFRI